MNIHVRRVLLALPFMVVVGWTLYARMSISDCPSFLTALKGGDTRTIVAAKTTVSKQISRVSVDGKMELWDTPHGQFWIPASPGDMLSTVISEQIIDLYSAKSLVRRGDTVIDCGADVGAFVRTALSAGAGRVIAVEPAPTKEPCLRRTFAREIADGRVIVFPKGVWNEKTILKLDGDRLSDRGVEVALTTIDDIVSQLSLDRVDLIKMDIEGAEKQALAGATLTLKRFRPRLTIATEHNRDDHTAIPALIGSIQPGYTTRCGPCVGQFGRLQPYAMHFVLD